MFNPYFHRPQQMLERKRDDPSRQHLEGLLRRVGHLDGDDLLLLMLIFLIFKDGEKDNVWSLLAVLVYCMI